EGEGHCHDHKEQRSVGNDAAVLARPRATASVFCSGKPCRAASEPDALVAFRDEVRILSKRGITQMSYHRLLEPQRKTCENITFRGSFGKGSAVIMVVAFGTTFARSLP